MILTWHSLLSPKLYRVLFAIFFVVTIYLMFNRPSQIQSVYLINDKVAHAITFFILSLLVCRSKPKSYGLLSISALVLFGLMIEVAQYFIPWRSFSVADWAADIAGILVYHILHIIRARYIRVRRG